ncbi:LysR family transcriptional regulator [Oxalobacteraceae bacterium A2-2]
MHFPDLDLNLLPIFDAVMREQNLTRAAGRLSLRQPTITLALKRLREMLGDELLIRTSHGVRPTARAEELWPAVQLALSSLESVIAADYPEVEPDPDTVRLMVSDSMASFLLPDLMAQIQEHQPGLKLVVSPLITRDPRKLLRQNQIDIAIGVFPEAVADLDAPAAPATPLRHQCLYQGELICMMRKDHPLARGELTLDDYCAAQHVQISLSGRTYWTPDDVLESLGRTRKVALTVNQFVTAPRVVAKSDLLSLVPRDLIAQAGMTEVLVGKAPPFPMPGLRADMLWHERDARAPRQQWLRGTLAAMQPASYD